MSNLICPLCHQSNVYQYWGQVWSSPDKKVMKCPDCDSYFLTDIASKSERKEFDDSYDSYIQSRAQYVLEDAKLSEISFESFVDLSIEERYFDLSKYFEGGSSLLEIGAEKGGFLEKVKKQYSQISAVDACPEYKEVLTAMGFDTYSYIWDVPSSQTYDRICFFSLLEHVIDPENFLNRVKKHLKPDGLIILEIPSAREPLLAVYDSAPFKSFYFQGMHPYVYSEKIIRLLFERSDLSVKEVICKQRYGLANHLQWLKSGTPGGYEFKSLVTDEVNKAYIKALEKSGNTDTMYIIACHK